jgi:hypothetical protein
MPIGTFNGTTVATPSYDNRPGLLDNLIKQNEQRKKDEIKAAEDAQIRNDKLTAEIGNAFLDENYLTGTVQDPYIRQLLADTRNKYLAELKANPNMSAADLQFKINQDIAKIGGISSNIKTVNAGVSQQVKQFSKEKGVNPDALQKLAMDKFMYKKDPKTGMKVLKSPDEMDPTQDYIGQVIDENPDLVLDRNTAFQSMLKDMPTYKVGHEVTTDKGGMKRTYDVNAEFHPFQKLAQDEKGNFLIDKNTNRPYHIVAGKKVDIGNGQMLDVAEDEAYGLFNENNTGRILINADFKDFNENLKRQGKSPIDPNSPEGDLIKRHLLYKRLESVPAKNLDIKDRRDQDAWAGKLAAGIASSNKAVVDALKQEKANLEWNSTKIGQLWNGANGSNEVLNAAAVTEHNGKKYFDLAQSTGGIILRRVGAERVYADKILVDPDNKGSVTVVVGKKEETYSGDDAKKFLARIAELNGVNLPEATKRLGVKGDAVQSQKDAETEKFIESKKKKFNWKNPLGVIGKPSTWFSKDKSEPVVRNAFYTDEMMEALKNKPQDELFIDGLSRPGMSDAKVKLLNNKGNS